MFHFSRRIAALPAEVLGLGTQDATGAAMTTSEALKRYFEEHYEALCRFLRYSGAGEAVAEDLSQEAFLRLYDHLKKGRPAQNIRAWLFRVSYRLWIDRLREGKREAPAVDQAWELWSQVLRDPSPGAEQQLLARERSEWLRAALLRLSQVERQALHLRADGLQYREIAEVLGLGYWPVVEAVRRAVEILGEEAHGL
jgi:RNA polymerase sigma-70 factor (ECF subfamily)